jgi:hypothetical protein
MEIGIIIAIVVALILLRVVFKVAKFVIVLALLILAGVVLWNMFVAGGTP